MGGYLSSVYSRGRAKCLVYASMGGYLSSVYTPPLSAPVHLTDVCCVAFGAHMGHKPGRAPIRLPKHPKYEGGHLDRPRLYTGGAAEAGTAHNLANQSSKGSANDVDSFRRVRRV